MRRILVINPNSNERVTAGLRSSLRSDRDDVLIEYCTLGDGPFGIESDADIRAAVPLVVGRVAASDAYDAFVIACYSDPGLAECRRQFDKPVFGMQQSALETAAGLGGRFGVIALSDESIARHLVYIEALGYRDRLAAELPLGVSVDAAASDPGTLPKVLATGQRLVDEFGASSLILGCAGMAAVRSAAEKKLPVPVVEPAQAALDLALDALR